MSHTPGPWTVKTPQSDPNAYDVYAGGAVITRGYWAHNGKADARLIAAAPELLEALKALVRHDSFNDERDGLPNCVELDHAVEVIAKAEGR